MQHNIESLGAMAVFSNDFEFHERTVFTYKESIKPFENLDHESTGLLSHPSLSRIRHSQLSPEPILPFTDYISKIYRVKLTWTVILNMFEGSVRCSKTSYTSDLTLNCPFQDMVWIKLWCQRLPMLVLAESRMCRRNTGACM